MKRLHLQVAIVVSILATPLRVHAFGDEGHETVGAIADELIRGKKAEIRVRQLLGNQFSLSHAATWADRAKSPSTQEMKAFVNANPKHRTYHYTDVAFQQPSYKLGSVGTFTNDIVHIMAQCIAVLQGKTGPKVNPHRFSPRISLLLLAHYVGDLHQPLHVGCAYLNDNQKFVDPNTSPGEFYEVQGGNFLTINNRNLHSF